MEKKSKAGRKKIDDKKVPVTLFVRESVVKKLGGIEKTKTLCYKNIDATFELKSHGKKE